MRERLVVIGGGAAGMSAASAARRADPDLEIVALEATGWAAYGLCGLPYYLAGVVAMPKALVAYPPRFFREERRIDLRLHARATGLDLDRGTVCFRQDGQPRRLGWHRLVVASGGSPALPLPPGVDDEAVFTVRTMEDAVKLRSLLDAGRIGHALVVGAGYIGLEMAEALAARGCRVTVAELLPRVMPNLDEELAALVEDEVRRQGVDLRLGAKVEELGHRRGQLEAVVEGEPLAVDAVVLAVGVRPNGGLAAAAGARTGPGVYDPVLLAARAAASRHPAGVAG